MSNGDPHAGLTSFKRLCRGLGIVTWPYKVGKPVNRDELIVAAIDQLREGMIFYLFSESTWDSAGISITSFLILNELSLVNSPVLCRCGLQ